MRKHFLKNVGRFRVQRSIRIVQKAITRALCRKYNAFMKTRWEPKKIESLMFPENTLLTMITRVE
jgi:hypothetical protein